MYYIIQSVFSKSGSRRKSKWTIFVQNTGNNNGSYHALSALSGLGIVLYSTCG